jgi:hypothetical protein
MLSMFIDAADMAAIDETLASTEYGLLPARQGLQNALANYRPDPNAAACSAWFQRNEIRYSLSFLVGVQDASGLTYAEFAALSDEQRDDLLAVHVAKFDSAGND